MPFRSIARLAMVVLCVSATVLLAAAPSVEAPASESAHAQKLEPSKKSTEHPREGEEKTLVLNYRDFGPQAAAWPLLGMEWHQWAGHGDSNPARQYDVKVVVFRDLDVRVVKKLYPVHQPSQRDYRYVPYQKAIRYLDDLIRENLVAEVTRTLMKTRDRLLRHFRTHAGANQ